MADEQAPKLESFEDLRSALNLPVVTLDATGAPAAPKEEAPAAPTAEATVVPPVTPIEPPVVPPVDPPVVPDKKPKRFSELTRELEVTRQQNADLAARLAAAVQPAAPVTPPAAAPLPEAEGRPTPPDATTWDKSWPELEVARAKYTEDLVAWSLKNDRLQRTVEQAREVEQVASRTVHEKWLAAYDAAVAIDEAIVDAVKHVGDQLVSAAKRPIIDVIKESEVAVEIVKELTADADKLKKLAGMSLASAAREIGKIEAAILSKQPAPAAPAAKLPAPPTEVGGGASGHTAGPDLTKLGEMPMASFKETVGKLLSGKKVALGADRRSL